MRRLALAFALLAACATGGERPRFGAVPLSVSMNTDRPAHDAITQLTARVRALGFGVVSSAPAEGYLETDWYDVQAKRPSAPPFDRLDSIVKLRFFADPIEGKTRVIGESVRRIAWDPSMPPRDLERMVPDGHPGRALLDSALVAVKPDSVPPPPLGRP